MDAAVLGDTAQRLDAGCRWDYDDLPYSNRHRYSALAALDYFREAALFDGSGLVDGRPDARLTDAVEMVRAARQPDGTWVQTAPLAGRTWFDVDVAEGEPSRWLTLFGTRVLKWWDAAA